MYINSPMFKLTISLMIFILSILPGQADPINKIEVTGNKRISKETIINFSDLTIGDEISEDQLNNSLKELYNSKFFENIDFKINKDTLFINVKEFPIIQEIKINGIKSNSQIESLKEELNLKEKNPFDKNLIQVDVNNILNAFKHSGFYFAKINALVENNNNDTVNIIFNVDRGKQVTIGQINFIGDKKYKKRKLRSIITSEEDRFWKFITNNKYLNIEKINLDKRLLKNFYLENGYYNVEIKDAYSQLTNEENFVLTFNINSGKKYYFGDFELELPTDFDPKKFDNLESLFKKIKDKTYNFNDIEKILDEIERISLIENYEFINANVVEKINDEKIDFIFQVEESEKIYVNQINIFGNTITSEEFIRNTLIVDEGDPLNKILQNKSANNLKARGIFKSVDYEIVDTTDNDLKDINYNIQEKPTGEISAGAGYGTDGSTFSFGIRENNFNGQGIKLESNLDLREDSVKGIFSYTTPNFLYTDRSLKTSIQSTSTDKLKDYGYKSSLNKILIGTRYEQFEDVFFSPNLSLSDESIKTDSTASTAYKKQEGSYFDLIFDYGLSFDKRNSRFQPSSGFVSKWYQSLPLVSDDTTIINGYQITGYKQIADDMVISTGFYSRAANSLSNEDVRVSKRLFVPSSRLRGFKNGSVGPKDGNDYVGGNYITTLNTSSTIPYIFQTAESLDLKLFFDAANVWGVDYSSSIDDSNKIRTSTGIALEINTPVGPLSFSYAEAITKASTDQTESFRFQLGTTF